MLSVENETVFSYLADLLSYVISILVYFRTIIKAIKNGTYRYEDRVNNKNKNGIKQKDRNNTALPYLIGILGGVSSRFIVRFLSPVLSQQSAILIIEILVFIVSVTMILGYHNYLKIYYVKKYDLKYEEQYVNKI